MSPNTPTEQPKQKTLILIAAGLSLLVLVVATLFITQEREKIRGEKYESLELLSSIKAEQLVQWHKERISEARYFSNFSDIPQIIWEMLQGKPTDNLSEAARAKLEHIVEAHSYSNIFVTDTHGDLLFSFRKDYEIPGGQTLDFIQQTLKQDDVLITDFYFCEYHQSIHYDFMALLKNENLEPFGIMVLRIDPDDFLFPLIKSWTAPSPTAETILIRREGDSLVYLNDLRLMQETALKLSVHLTEREDLVVQAYQQKKGILSGHDYRGSEVLAWVRPVEPLPWIMISKIDQDEIFSELNLKAAMIIGFALMVVFMVWAALGWYYRRLQDAAYRKLLKKEKELQLAENEFRISLYSIGDGVITTDVNGRVRKMNYVAEQLTGWIESEAFGQPVERVFHIINEYSRSEVENPVKLVLRRGSIVGLANHTLLVSKDGKEIPIADSGAPMRDADGLLTGVVLVFRDQSLEREAEKKLRESEERYRALVEVSTEAIFINQDDRIVYVNPAAMELFGAENEKQVLGRSPLDFFHKDYHHIIRERIRLMLATGKAANRIEEKITTIDGRVVDVEVAAVPFVLNKRRVIQVVMRDISERLKAAEALRKSEERHRTLYETMLQGVVYQDENGQIVSANPAAERILGLTLEQMQGRKSTDPRWRAIREDGTDFPGDEHPSMVALKTGKTIANTMMGVFNPLKESFTWINIYAIPLFREGENKPYQVYTNFEDITLQKKSELALRESEERYRMLFESNPHPMWVYDLESLRILDVNRAAVNKYGYTREEFLTMTLKDIRPPDDVPRLLENIATHDEVLQRSAEWRHKLKDGSIIFVEIASHSILYRGRKARLVLVSDITERRQNQKLREQVILANQTARIKQNFLANMSHEIRTPLTGIIGMTELLRETATSEKQEDYIETIRTSSQHLMDVINNILDFSKIEAGKMTVAPKVFSTNKLLEKSRKLFNSLCQKNITFAIEPSANLPEHIRADEQRIFQIITNLLGNAIKFTEKGSITLKAAVREAIDNEQVVICFEISDTGIGIPKEHQEKVFHLFSQVEDSDVRSFEGTGLGLAISRELTHLLGGKIGLRSREGVGSTFWFTFVADVVKDQPRETQPVKKSPGPADTPRHFLLVEDKAVNRKVITLILEGMGHKVTPAENGEVAIEKFQPDVFDVILMDIQMPVMDGIAAVKKLRELHESLPPVIGLSANAFEGDAQRYIEQGMDDYLTKPVIAEDFERVLKKWFG
jgi:PAS domain S-box-containing protein